MQRASLGALALGIVIASSVAGCSSGTSSALPTSSPAPAAGVAKLTVGGTTSTLAVQLCVNAAGGSLNLTAVGSATPAADLTANLADPVTGSTMVFTTRKADNSFTTYSMSSAGSTKPTGRLVQTRFLLDGQAVVQAWDPAGRPNGPATHEKIALDASCRIIQPEQPAPSFAPSKTAPGSAKASKSVTSSKTG